MNDKYRCRCKDNSKGNSFVMAYITTEINRNYTEKTEIQHFLSIHITKSFRIYRKILHNIFRFFRLFPSFSVMNK